METGWYRIKGLAKAHLVADGWFGPVAACGAGRHREFEVAPATDEDARCEVCARVNGLNPDPKIPLEARLWMRDLAQGHHEESCPQCRQPVSFPFVGLALHEKTRLEQVVEAVWAVAGELGITKKLIEQVGERIGRGQAAEEAVRELLGGREKT